jgi:formylglycine-generating enzyme required for sulfatase activity
VNGQNTHTAGAPYWLSSLDEWIKATHYDPNKYGPGQGGYWLYPVGRDAPPPVGGLPGTPGAETGAGDYHTDPNNPFREYPVGSYPLGATPWGLLDASGGLMEWTEGATIYGDRHTAGSANSANETWESDRLDDSLFAADPGFAVCGIRMASSVPAPGVPALGLALQIIIRQKADRVIRIIWVIGCHAYIPQTLEFLNS